MPEPQGSNRSVHLLGKAGAIFLGLVAVAGLLWQVVSSRTNEEAMATQIAKQSEQIIVSEEQKALAETQVALGIAQNTVIAEQATWIAEEAVKSPGPLTGTTTIDTSSPATATASVATWSALAVTQQAITDRQKQIEATQTAIVELPPVFECSTDDFIPDFGGTSPPIDQQICITEGRVAWISSDPASFTIPSIFAEPANVGFTFSLFGPVKFTLSGVPQEKVRLDVRPDASLVGNFDGKSLNLVYKDGKYCLYSQFDGLSCP